MADLYYYRGDQKSWTLTFEDSDGNAIDITDWTVYFTVKASYDDDDPNDDDAILAVDVTSHDDPANGKTTISFNWSDFSDEAAPGEYVYDIQVKKANGYVKTITTGKFFIDDDVTKRT